ncbi:efflux RND transporter periplasmic adaptor subunit [Neptuniibacter sp. 2_MG-2023]|uniref:efflux RND transporter periplasmic adaptor subunit n=1 Tax=Neptuniibacter sp. 2_MG-2023 TaxID=3062671 RepID=UPI0026E432C3|nr:efflux RND transporter periplasmic adaptor subunit [Neptuniibacter sp. 2_MG-2023]MDO6512639.1 efflux RND transporter periplasmic adaptor subunit [Neptuniibacter sp. 2_MG-2023]
MPMLNKSYFTFSVAILTALLSLSSFAKGLPAEVITVANSILDKKISAVGSLRANESVMLRPEQSGRIEEILFEEGEKVEQGKPLFKLDSSVYIAELKSAQASVQLSRVDYERAKSLLKKKVGSAQDRDSTLAQLRVDQAHQALAQAKLDKMTIKAPFTGYTGLRLVSPGDFVDQGENLVRLTDYSKLKLDLKFPEIYLSELKNGRILEVNVDALPGEVIKGKVTAVSPSSDNSAHNIEIRAEIANDEGKLRPGLFAQVSLLVDQQETVVVPEQAIIPSDGEFFVMTVTEEHTVAMTPIKMGQRRPGVVQIIEGLTAGDILIIAGQIKLKHGMPVTPIFVDGSQKETTTDKQG